MSKKGWIIIFFGIIAFVGFMFFGVDSLMCEEPCV